MLLDIKYAGVLIKVTELVVGRRSGVDMGIFFVVVVHEVEDVVHRLCSYRVSAEAGC